MDEIIIFGVIRACELALLAVSFTLVFGALGFANVANTEFATFGAYGVVLAMSATGLALLPAAVLSILLVAAGGVVIYYLVLRRLIRRSPTTALIGSFALSLVLRALLQSIAGPDPRQISTGLERGQEILGVLVTPTQIRLVVISVSVLAVLLVVLRFTPLGRSIRAVSADPDLSSAAGINSARVINVVWVIAGALGALAGILLALDTAASIEMGFNLLLPVFAVAVLGGLGSPAGAIVAALIIALLEIAIVKVDFGHLVGSGDYLIPVSYRTSVSFVLLVLMLLVRPQGLFGRQVRRA